MQIYFLICSSVIATCAHQYNIRVGMTFPFDNHRLKSYSGFETSAAAVTIALDRVRRDNVLPGANFSFVIKNCQCREEIAADHVIDLLEPKLVDVVISSPCAQSAFISAVICTRFNIPLLNWAVTTADMADEARFRIVSRTIGPYRGVGRAIAEVLSYFDWHRVALLFTDDGSTRKCHSIAQGAMKYLSQRRIQIVFTTKIDHGEPRDEEIDRFLDNFEKTARIAVVCIDNGVRNLMLRAQERGMTSEDYVYILPEYVQNENRTDLWINYESADGRNTEAKSAFNTSLFLEMQLATQQELHSFKNLVPKKMRLAPFFYSQQKHDENYGSLYSPFLHDAVYLYALALNKTLGNGGSVSDGLRIVQNSKKVQFAGLSGYVSTDEAANRNPTFVIKALDKNNRLLDLAKVRTHRKDGDTVELLMPAVNIWETRNNYRPTGVPRCGWSNENCSSQSNTLVTSWILVSVVGTLVLLVSIIIIIYFLKKRKVVNDASQMPWKINYKDLVQLKDMHASYNTLNSAMSDETTEAMLRGVSTVAHFQRQLVWMKIHNASIVLTSEKDRSTLSMLRDVAHENLNPFVGLCIDSPKPISVWHYCSKGSLEDILLNSSINLDWYFKFSLIKDLASGLEHLHCSGLHSHGYLKSTNCLVDSSWVLKITDYGLSLLREGYMPTAKEQLWTAPELLRLSQMPVCGTTKGDVYSFGIVVSEIISRDKPFAMFANMTNEEIVVRVRAGDTPPFRPILRGDRGDSDADPNMLSSMRDCWLELPDRRPDIKEIRNSIKQIGRGKTANLMDHVLKMMETHAKNLEAQVNERTKQLNDEMKKSDILLYRMLPAVIAERLKKGQTVEPETYESVSVFFSNVSGFSSIAQRSSPYQLITFLNDICTMFDSIIENYDVFKVETVNDGYLVVSGLPHRNGHKHASEIADMALNLQLSLVSFFVPSMPKEKFEIRSGIHTGPVVAGVVGLALPRYCLFGDTVNVANRIETNGKPSCIHISDETNKCLTQVIGGYITKPRGEIIIKGKGVMYTHWLLGKKIKSIQDKTEDGAAEAEHRRGEGKNL